MWAHQTKPNWKEISISRTHLQNRWCKRKENRLSNIIHRKCHCRVGSALCNVHFMRYRNNGNIFFSERQFSAMYLSADEIACTSSKQNWRRKLRKHIQMDRKTSVRFSLTDAHSHTHTHSLIRICYVEIINLKIGFIKLYEFFQRVKYYANDWVSASANVFG